MAVDVREATNRRDEMLAVGDNVFELPQTARAGMRACMPTRRCSRQSWKVIR